MAQFVFDSFTDADGTALTAHTGETGATWAMGGGFGASIGAITSNRARANTAVGYGVIYASGTPASAEYDVSAPLYKLTSAGKVGIAGRHTTSGTAYFVYTDGSTWTLYKVVGGTYTSLGTYSQALSTGVPYVVKLELRNAAKNVYIDGVLRITSADNAITGAGFAGVWLEANTSGTAGFALEWISADDPVTGYTGAATATGTGSAAAAGSLSYAGAGTATGTGTAAAAGSLTYVGAGTATGAGGATAAGVVPSSDYSGAGTATGAGTAAATGTLTFVGSGTAGGSGTAAAAGALTWVGFGTATGSGTATAAGTLTFVGSGTATGSGSAVAGEPPAPFVFVAPGTLVTTVTAAAGWPDPSAARVVTLAEWAPFLTGPGSGSGGSSFWGLLGAGLDPFGWFSGGPGFVVLEGRAFARPDPSAARVRAL